MFDGDETSRDMEIVKESMKHQLLYERESIDAHYFHERLRRGICQMVLGCNSSLYMQ